MEIKEFDKVKILSSGAIGVVVDIHITKGEQIYIVECKDTKGGWTLFDCLADEIEKL